MARAILMVMDSVGIGNAPDAERFGDFGADTLGHIAAACASGQADRSGLRAGPLRLPNLERLGLACAAAAATGRTPDGMACPAGPQALWGHAAEISHGKDTPSGHWEIAGVPVQFDWGYFPHTVPAFPAWLTDALMKEARLGGLLGNKHASGTQIIAELGEEHIRTGWPILYTSADSVLQIAAHETHFGLERLYALCLIAKKLVEPLNIGRVIARPFIGESAAQFERTGNRRDYSVPPPAPTLLDRVQAAGGRVIAVGKIGDIFAQQGVSKVIKANGNDALVDATLLAMAEAGDGDLVFTNFVDFDMLYGHRRDIAGYAAALEAFDRRLPEIEAGLQRGDMAVLTADHGCDPSWRGTDHTREQVPVLAFGQDIGAGPIGGRRTFSDIAQSILAHLGLAKGPHGTPFV